VRVEAPQMKENQDKHRKGNERMKEKTGEKTEE
jgi:hypothetical protein